jgi:hypothetical protein
MLQLWTNLAANTNAPTVVGDGFSLTGFNNTSRRGLDTAGIMFVGTGDTFIGKLWLWRNDIEEWAPAGAHETSATRGILNLGNAITPISGSKLVHTELLEGLKHYDAVCLQGLSFGTATVNAYLFAR